MALQGHPRSLILASIDSAYATSYWSSISNLCNIPFQRYCTFSAEKSDPTLFHPNVGVFPLIQIADVVAPRSEDPRLIIRVISFELVQPYAHGASTSRTDGQTDDLRQQYRSSITQIRKARETHKVVRVVALNFSQTVKRRHAIKTASYLGLPMLNSRDATSTTWYKSQAYCWGCLGVLQHPQAVGKVGNFQAVGNFRLSIGNFHNISVQKTHYLLLQKCFKFTKFSVRLYRTNAVIIRDT